MLDFVAQNTVHECRRLLRVFFVHLAAGRYFILCSKLYFPLASPCCGCYRLFGPNVDQLGAPRLRGGVEEKHGVEQGALLSLGTLSEEEVDLHESAENKYRGGKRAEAAYRRAAQKAAKNAEKRVAKERRAAEKELSKKALREDKKGEGTSHMPP